MILIGNYTSYFLDEKFSVNGEELREEDFDEDPTEIIDGEVKSDEMDAPTPTGKPIYNIGTNTNAFPFPFRSLIN